MLYRLAGVRRFLALIALSLASSAPAYGQAQFRAFWADVFHFGYRSTSEIDTMVSLARQGHYNAIIVEVMAYMDNSLGSHGAFWNSSLVPAG